ncbi:hypothetical protein EJB05_50784, partial [Eragrostis curvula]
MGEETKAAGKGGGRGDKKKDAGAAAAPAARPQPIVLKIDLHCLSCARKVRKAIKRAPGVAADIVAGNLIVTGPADTAELKERIEARTKKSVQIVAAGAGPPEKEKKADKEKGGGGDEKKALLISNTADSTGTMNSRRKGANFFAEAWIDTCVLTAGDQGLWMS